MAWAAAVASGLSQLGKYERARGVPAHPCGQWPADTHIVRAAGLPALVLLLHPHCPCSCATIGELAKVMTDCRGHLAATVLMLRPTGMAEKWEQTDLWDYASAIPGVSVFADCGGTESRRFGAATSGQTLLFAADGRLIFAGGITNCAAIAAITMAARRLSSLVLDGNAPAQPVHAGVWLSAIRGALRLSEQRRTQMPQQVIADPDAAAAEAADKLYQAHRQGVYRRTDRMFALLMAMQWLFGIAAAVFVSPRTWAGTASQVHPPRLGGGLPRRRHQFASDPPRPAQARPALHSVRDRRRARCSGRRC